MPQYKEIKFYLYSNNSIVNYFFFVYYYKRIFNSNIKVKIIQKTVDLSAVHYNFISLYTHKIQYVTCIFEIVNVQLMKFGLRRSKAYLRIGQLFQPL